MAEDEIVVEGWPPPDRSPEAERWFTRLRIRRLLADYAAAGAVIGLVAVLAAR